jgi:predicted TIM-barrel fold metal-dependent hydrolase
MPAVKPWIEACIELFGVGRWMCESDCPVDKITWAAACRGMRSSP